MDHEEIRQRIIGEAIRYAMNYSLSAYKALNDIALRFYNFSSSRGLNVLFKTNYRERFFDYVLGNEKALTAEEIRFVSIYFRHTCSDKVYDEAVFEKFRKGVEKHRAEIQRITKSTEKIRRSLNNLAPFEVYPRIENYIKYFREVLDEPDDGVAMYTSLYYIGFIDGKREERARRKRKTAPVGEEETV